VVAKIEQDDERAQTLGALAQAYTQTQRFDDAERMAAEILDKQERAQALRKIAEMYAHIAAMTDGDQRTNLQQALLHFVQRHWLQATTNDELTPLLLLAEPILRYDSANEVGFDLVQAFDHVDRFWQMP
jgi:hypothetical protein